MLLCCKGGKWGLRGLCRVLQTSVSTMKKQGAFLLPREEIKIREMLPKPTTIQRFSKPHNRFWFKFFQRVFDSFRALVAWWLVGLGWECGISTLSCETGMDLTGEGMTTIELQIYSRTSWCVGLIWCSKSCDMVVFTWQFSPWLQTRAAPASCLASTGLCNGRGLCSWNWSTEGQILET